MFSFLYQILFHVINTRKNYYANIYHLTRSFIFYYCKKVVQMEDSKFCAQLQAECRMQILSCYNTKLVLVTDLYIYERSYCGKKGEIFIS